MFLQFLDLLFVRLTNPLFDLLPKDQPSRLFAGLGMVIGLAIVWTVLQELLWGI